MAVLMLGIASPVVDTDPAGALTPKDELCAAVKASIVNLTNVLYKRYGDLRLNARDLPRYGSMSVESHRTAHLEAQKGLRNKLNSWKDNGCGGDYPPGSGSAWQYATRPTPYPAYDGRWNGHAVTSKTTGSLAASNDRKTFAWFGAAIAAGTTIWWGAKVVAPLCGPAAPICVVAL